MHERKFSHCSLPICPTCTANNHGKRLARIYEGGHGMSTWTEIAEATKPASTLGIDSDDLDCWLIERIARQDRTAMQQLLERHHSRISGFFSGLALDKNLT